MPAGQQPLTLLLDLGLAGLAYSRKRKAQGQPNTA